MNKFILIIALLTSLSSFSQDIFGKWKTIDDETGEAKSIVEIYKKNDYVFGKVVEILNKDKRDAICDTCEGDEKGQPILGLEIIKNMEKSGQYYKEGTIFDPTKGKKYTCRLGLTDNKDVLQVRGYIAFLYSTQYWERVK
ncbi:DUF2147 domain-containing protein [Bizionia gelidisalsuginis]|uniref:DUF2147 domain-containing protein n=2 Tax=Bizionia TaxID=283785 RepID=A0A8H2LDN8_9FLAO|nr:MULTISPECIES: DUF2147 domain-containing protein [Bizionia]TYB73141.1 DUF2147 domain-containing protein [Bizionia saleffrena]TYC14910.1 DUF2147 domain-containing protein [Bizionia gelidisalsuginis]